MGGTGFLQQTWCWLESFRPTRSTISHFSVIIWVLDFSSCSGSDGFSPWISDCNTAVIFSCPGSQKLFQIYDKEDIEEHVHERMIEDWLLQHPLIDVNRTLELFELAITPVHFNL